METTLVEWEGKELEVEYEMDDGEKESVDCPGSAPRADIHSIKYQGLELIDLIAKSSLEHFEAKVYWQVNG